MIPYELLEHTADAKFRAYGETLEEALGNAVRATAAIVTDPASLPQDVERQLAVRASDLKGLLFAMIDEIIFLVDTESFLPALARDVKVTQGDDGCALEMTLLGGDARLAGGNLKAATYHDMRVERHGEGWVAQAVVDI